MDVLTATFFRLTLEFEQTQFVMDVPKKEMGNYEVTSYVRY